VADIVIRPQQAALLRREHDEEQRAAWLHRVGSKRVSQRHYDIKLSAPADLPQNRPDPSELIKALEKQVGLKVTLKTMPLRMLVIDRMDRIPTEN
jgi:uncharacterized protein (TIGR03435 family)